MLQIFRNLADKQYTVNIILPERVGDLKTLLDQSSNNNRGVDLMEKGVAVQVDSADVVTVLLERMPATIF